MCLIFSGHVTVISFKPLVASRCVAISSSMSSDQVSEGPVVLVLSWKSLVATKYVVNSILGFLYFEVVDKLSAPDFSPAFMLWVSHHDLIM